MAKGAVNLPPGFVLEEDAQTSDSVNLPQGFVLENQPAINIPGVPGASRVATAIANRPNQWQELANRFTTLPSIRDLANPFFPAQVAGTPMMTAMHSIEQPIANVGMDIQRGQFPALLKMAMAGLPGMGSEPSAISGFTGQKPGEFGDILRGAGVPEPLSATGGLLASMAIPMPLPGVNKAVKNVSNAVEQTGKSALESATFPIRKDIGAISQPELNRIIDTSIEKAIRPSVAGKKTPALLNRYKMQARDAVRAIVEHKDMLNMTDEYGDVRQGSLPQSLHEFSQAIDQVKNKVFSDYNLLKNQAGMQGVGVELQPIVMDLLGQVNNKVVKALYPELQTYAGRKMRGMLEAGSFNLDDAQKAIEMLNNDLKAYYRNPNPQSASNAVFDAALATKLRQAVDKAVTNLTGKSYSGLKNKYGALRAIQDDVLHRAIVDARKNPKGFFDLADVFATGDLVQGLLSLNPGKAMHGSIMRSVLNTFKALNNPNRMVKNMFDAVDKSYRPMAEPSYNPGARLLEGTAGKPSAQIEGQASPKMIGVTNRAGEGFDLIMSKDSAERIGARVRQVVGSVNQQKALPAPMEFERLSREEAIKRLQDFTFRHYYPKLKKIIIPSNIMFEKRSGNMLREMGINPWTGKFKTQKALTAFEIAWRNTKSKKAFDLGERGFVRIANVTPQVKQIAKEIPQSIGAGNIPKQVTNSAPEIEKGVQQIEVKIKADPDKFSTMPGSPIVSNQDYGVAFTPDASCPKGKVLRDKTITMRSAMDKAGFSSEEKTAAARKLFEAGIKQGLDAPCVLCYEYEKQLIGYNAKPMSFGSKIYQPGMIMKSVPDIKARGGVLRGYAVGDMRAVDIPSLIHLGKDLGSQGLGFGTYTKNLNFVEIFGDTGFKFNVSTGKTPMIGLPREIVEVYRKRYPNVASNYVAINEADLLDAGKDPRVDKIIPAHLGGGTPAWFLKNSTGLSIEDFKAQQSEKVLGKVLHSDKIDLDPEKLAKARELIKKSKWSGDPKEYFSAIQQASRILGEKVSPMFEKYSSEKWYGKLIGTGPSEYGQTPGVAPIDMSKVNLGKASEYMKRPDIADAPIKARYGEIAKKILSAAHRGGVKAINAMDARYLGLLLGLTLPNDEDQNRRNS